MKHALALALALTATSASAEGLVIGAHLASIHVPQSTYCNNNHGLYARYDLASGFGLQVGRYNNSLCTGWNTYAFATYETQGDGFRYGAAVGAAKGYKKDGSLTLMAGLTGSYPLFEQVRGRVLIAPLIGDRVKQAGMKVGVLFHFTIERSF